ncbi:radical SAM protein [Candidatus Arthromitus sp. SFB-rat-Yit]|uniref:radical SAM protein n=1 Tax=Candidatus Arthromitus sp. SFB-rat-Yit TaxID=1041504 RepID=UPI000227A490|nr:radical SAM protein [Candidatus Arthromitus sp. SFB-rat-Yit]BAK81556.1 radical SAM-superfamily protein [Candidatus Arthromitus sp. SFB-rat-Yit]
MKRYSVISEKNKREIVLLRGSGCIYKKCTFCDYYLDMSNDFHENFLLNKSVIDNVTGEYDALEVINSGSVFELDKKTIDLIKSVCNEKGISTIHFESHYIYRKRIPKLKEEFSEFNLKMKLGLETFDYDFRENIFNKGIHDKDPKIISEYFDEANFLFGISGQTINSMMNDIELGLENFERICVNIMCKNSSTITPDKEVIEKFMEKIYPKYKEDYRLDILINNTGFGVGD